MFLEQSAAPCPKSNANADPGAHERPRRCGGSFRRAALLISFSVGVLFGSLERAHAQGFSAAQAGSEDKRSRGTWAALLIGYFALGALATGGAYLLRDNFVGRSVAVGAAGWGGLGVGAGAGYGTVHLYGCEAPDCSMKEHVGVGVGGILGALAATIAGHLLTSDPGMSRPYTTAAGLAPAFAYLTVGTITDW